MYSAQDDRALPRPGCPIRRSPDQRPLSGSPELFAARHVLRRLLAPRHSPCALSSLTMVASPHVDRERTQPQVSYHALALALFYPSRLSKTERGVGPKAWRRFESASEWS